MNLKNAIQDMKKLSCIYILARNEIAHFSNFKTLEDVLRVCKCGMKIFRTLEMFHPNNGRLFVIIDGSSMPCTRASWKTTHIILE